MIRGSIQCQISPPHRSISLRRKIQGQSGSPGEGRRAMGLKPLGNARESWFVTPGEGTGQSKSATNVNLVERRSAVTAHGLKLTGMYTTNRFKIATSTLCSEYHTVNDGTSVVILAAQRSQYACSLRCGPNEPIMRSHPYT